MVVAARRGAERETMKRLAAVPDEPGRALLDHPLIPDESTDRTLLTWLRQGEVATTPTAILSALERRATLIGWGVDRWDLRRSEMPATIRLRSPFHSFKLDRIRPSKTRGQ
jgi:uncharacterized protein (DUF2126 family)